jgi:two-component system, cell cycle sensor histidine kinase and response regulator CckA
MKRLFLGVMIFFVVFSPCFSWSFSEQSPSSGLPSWCLSVIIGSWALILALSAVAFFFRFQIQQRNAQLKAKKIELDLQLQINQAAERTLIRQKEYMAVFHETTLGLIGRLELEELLEAMISRAGELLGTSDGFIYLENPEENCIQMRMASGRYKKAVGAKVYSGEGISGKVWESGDALLVNDYSKWQHRLNEAIYADLHSVMASPLSSEAASVGVIGLGHFEKDKKFNHEDLKILNRFAELAAIAIDNARLYASLQKELVERRRTEAFLESILNSSIDWIITTSLDGIIRYTSQRAPYFTGYNIHELVGMNIGSLYEQGALEAEELLAYIKENGELRHHALRLLKRDDAPLDVSLSASLLKNDAGETLGILGIYRDISESKRLEFQFQHAQRMEAIGTLAGGIAHNFNNLLMGIQGNISLLKLELGTENRHTPRAETIEKHIQSGSRLTRQLMGYAKKGHFEVRPLDMNLLIQEVAGTFAETRKEIRVYLNLDKNLPAVPADRGQIEQMLMNLFVNASDAMPYGGDLTVRTEIYGSASMNHRLLTLKKEPYLKLTVQDTGIGMDEKTRERIFEPFFTTKGIEKGTGLGLASTYGIIESHGGMILVDSAPGEGACFQIFLPVARQRPDLLPEQRVMALHGNETILVVDDEPLILEVGSEMLESLGYRVLRAESGEEALNLCNEDRSLKVDLVVLDIIMPGLGGAQTLERMRQIRPEMKILLSSGYSLDDRAADLMAKGGKGFLQKPFNLSELSFKVREVLDGPNNHG